MPELIVIHKPLYYGGKEVAVGAKFNATPVDAAWLMKTMRAQPAPVSKPVRKVAETAPPAPAAPVADEGAREEDAPRPFYRNRRLKSED